MTECDRLISEGFITEQFLQEEIRNGYTVTQEIKKVWAIELDLYREIKRVCDKYRLKVWVAFGTLLGAIRHDGFIPWDDDFDIWMPREDYEKLLSLGTTEFKKPYFLQTTLNDNDYYSAFARLRNSNTTGILNVSRRNACNNGIFVDIFPLDGAPKNRKEAKRRLFINHTRNVIAHAYVYNINPHPMARMTNRILHLPFIPYDYKRAYKVVNRYAQKYTWKDSSYVGMMAFPWKYSAYFVFRKKYFKNTIMHKFEFLEVPVPSDYNSILEERYGDYMEFPPLEERGMWHEFEFAPDIPYKEYNDNRKTK